MAAAVEGDEELVRPGRPRRRVRQAVDGGQRRSRGHHLVLVVVLGGNVVQGEQGVVASRRRRGRRRRNVGLPGNGPSLLVAPYGPVGVSHLLRHGRPGAVEERGVDVAPVPPLAAAPVVPRPRAPQGIPPGGGGVGGRRRGSRAGLRHAWVVVGPEVGGGHLVPVVDPGVGVGVRVCGPARGEGRLGPGAAVL